MDAPSRTVPEGVGDVGSGGSGRHPALVWAASGLMPLSGPEGGPPALASGRWVERLDGVVDDISLVLASVGGAKSLGLDAAAALGERAALVGRGGRGSVSVGGACRMVAAADGELAVSLARTSDVEMVPAWLELDPAAVDDGWAAVISEAKKWSVSDLVERAGWLGLAVGEVGRPPPPLEPCSFFNAGPAAADRRLVLDVSSLWAGPLCASLLGRFGWDGVKVVGPRRPDGARYGSPAFYELLNGEKVEVEVDLGGQAGRRRFRELCEQAAVVVDGLRPRVWDNWGVNRQEVAASCGLVWVSITGHGDNRAGFGDDAAVGGGLWLDNPDGGLPWFVGDAAADPIAGLIGCRAAAAAVAAGRAGVVEVAMSQAVSWIRAGDDLSVSDAELFRHNNKWYVRADDDQQEVLPPHPR